MADHPAGCLGHRPRVSGRTIALCYGCARYGKPGEQIEPAAQLDSRDEWQCQERVPLVARLVDGEETV